MLFYLFVFFFCDFLVLLKGSRYILSHLLASPAFQLSQRLRKHTFAELVRGSEVRRLLLGVFVGRCVGVGCPCSQQVVLFGVSPRETEGDLLGIPAVFQGLFNKFLVVLQCNGFPVAFQRFFNVFQRNSVAFQCCSIFSQCFSNVHQEMVFYGTLLSFPFCLGSPSLP